MASGIPVSPEIVQAYQDVNQRKNWAVIIKLENNLMVVDKTFSDGSNDPEADWNEVLRLLKEGGSRYVICDFKSKETELVTKSKLCLIAYVSEDSKVFEKMLYSSTFVTLNNELDAPKTIQANDIDDITYTTLKKAIFSS